MGLQATNAGINFQQRISAFMMILMEFEFDIDTIFSLNYNEKIVQLNYEAAEKIDDLVVTTETGKKIYMQMKRTLSFSEDANSEFVSVCKQFVGQYLENRNDDLAYILVTRTEASSKITIKLKRVLDGIRLANSLEIEEDLSKEEKEILNRFQEILKNEYLKKNGSRIQNEGLKELIKRIYIEVFDIEKGENFERNVKLILYNRLSVNVNLFWNMLIALSVEYGANRRCLEKSYLHTKIKNYTEQSTDEVGGLELVYKEGQMEMVVQKDYVIAIPQKGFMDEHLDKKQIFIMELYRFENGEKKIYPQYEIPNLMKISINQEFTILFRCSTQKRMLEYVEKELKNIADEDTVLIYAPVKTTVKETEVGNVHKDMLNKKIISQKDNRCINCGKAIYAEEAYIIEMDNIECNNMAGWIHKECLRPVDRVLGDIFIPNVKNPESLKNFDVNLWIKLLLEGKQVWGNLERLNARIQHLHIDPDEVFHDGRYCIRTILQNGNVRYTLYRGVVDRLGKQEADELVEMFNKQFEVARSENNPICYSSESYAYGPYNYLLDMMGNKEEFIECERSEVVLYNDIIAKLYNDGKTYYAPLIYLTIDGMPLIFNGAFPLFTNPLEIEKYVCNWKEVGVDISAYEINIIQEDNDFILKMISLISGGTRPIVNMLIGRDGSLRSGCIIGLTWELEAHSDQDNYEE